MKRIITSLLVVALFAVLGCGGSGSTNKYTLDKFNQVQTGMTYDQVKSIMGDAGQVTTESKSPSIPGVSDEIIIKGYEWQNPDGSNMQIMFMNNQVDTKAQAGLK